MIQPNQITDYTRTRYQLEEFVLFGIAVINKPATRTACYLESILSTMTGHSPFEKIQNYVRQYGHQGLIDLLHLHHITPHNMKGRAMAEVCHHDVGSMSSTCLYNVLLLTTGIGRKTASFICTHSFADFDKPILDTHILKWLATQGVQGVPSSTPGSDASYNRLCDEFIRLKPKDKTVAEFDLEIWNQYSVSRKDNTGVKR